MRSLNHRLKYGMTLGLFALVTFCTQPARARPGDACCDTSDGTCTSVTPTCIGCNSPKVCIPITPCSSSMVHCKTSEGVCKDVNETCLTQTCGFVVWLTGPCRLASNGICTLVGDGCSSACAGPTTQCILYVDADATGADDGSSWTDAYSKLQDALDDAVADDEIWVAEGTYYPDQGASVMADDREASFVLVDGLRIYGGFDGTETARTGRDPENNVTILSGDIKQDDGTALNQTECESAAYGDGHGWDTDAEPDVCLYVHEVREIYADAETSSPGFCVSLNGGEWDADRETRCFFVSRHCSGGSTPGAGCQDDADCPGSGTCVAHREQIRNADNSVHVVTVGKNVDNVVIDGFTITAGNANRKLCVNGLSPGVICLTDSDCPNDGQDEGICSKVCAGGPDVGVACDVDVDCARACVGGDDDGEPCGPGVCAAPGVCPLFDCTHELLGSQGGGIINRDVAGPATAINNDLTVRNCIFDTNYSRNHGAFNDHGTDTVIDDCEFKNNVTGVRGGGLYTHKDSDATVTDCIFRDNYSGYRGGGMYVNSDEATASAVTVSDCLFENNEVFALSGGLNGAIGSVLTVSDTEFRGNSAIAPSGAGGAIWTERSTLDVTDCIFEGNTGVASAAVRLVLDSDATFTRCTFLQNEATKFDSRAGAIELADTSCIIDDCDFVENSAANAGAVRVVGETLTVINSRFVRNTATLNYGGAISVYESLSQASAKLTNCVFVDNDDGAVFALYADLDAVNCLFARNESTGGGATFAYEGTVAIVNSTIADNVATGSGGGILNFGTLTVDNGILWGNTDAGGDDESSQLHEGGGTATVTYTDWSGHSGGTGNIDDDPDFIGSVETGTWTSVAAYDPVTGTTTFTKTGAGWDDTDDGEFARLILQPDTSVEDYTIVTANTDDTITAWGEFDSCSSSCSSFDIVDYRLDDAGNPSTNSPCIDTGDDDALPPDTQDCDDDSNTTEDIPCDLDGATRVVDSETSSEDVDMGCYEIQ